MPWRGPAAPQRTNRSYINEKPLKNVPSKYLLRFTDPNFLVVHLNIQADGLSERGASEQTVWVVSSLHPGKTRLLPLQIGTHQKPSRMKQAQPARNAHKKQQCHGLCTEHCRRKPCPFHAFMHSHAWPWYMLAGRCRLSSPDGIPAEAKLFSGQTAVIVCLVSMCYHGGKALKRRLYGRAVQTARTTQRATVGA